MRFKVEGSSRWVARRSGLWGTRALILSHPQIRVHRLPADIGRWRTRFVESRADRARPFRAG